MSTFSDNKKLTVVNFFSGPCCGKSTTAAAVFSEMKKQGYKVELVHEYPKDLVWEQARHMFTEQDYIFAHQHRMIRRLVDHDIDYAIVDSSIILGLMYLPDWYPASFKQFVLDVFNTYDNLNIVLKRNPSYGYDETGRNQTHQEAIAIDQATTEMLDQHHISYQLVTNDSAAANTILSIIKQHENNKNGIHSNES